MLLGGSFCTKSDAFGWQFLYKLPILCMGWQFMYKIFCFWVAVFVQNLMLLGGGFCTKNPPSFDCLFLSQSVAGISNSLGGRRARS